MCKKAGGENAVEGGAAEVPRALLEMGTGEKSILSKIADISVCSEVGCIWRARVWRRRRAQRLPPTCGICGAHPNEDDRADVRLAKLRHGGPSQRAGGRAEELSETGADETWESSLLKSESILIAVRFTGGMETAAHAYGRGDERGVIEAARRRIAGGEMRWGTQ